MQAARVFFTFLALSGFGSYASRASASAFLPAVLGKSRREVPDWGAKPAFIIGVMNLPKASPEETSFPEPMPVELPGTTGFYTARDWRLILTKGHECYVPENSVLLVTSLSKSRVTGLLQWPSRYMGGTVHCPGRTPPLGELCEDGTNASIRDCANGEVVLMELSGDDENRADVMKDIRRAIGLMDELAAR